MTELEQRLYGALNEIRLLADTTMDAHVIEAASALDKVSDIATLACAQVWRAQARNCDDCDFSTTEGDLTTCPRCRGCVG